MGEFRTRMNVDDEVYPITIFVIADEFLEHNMILGLDFLRTINYDIKNGEIFMGPKKPVRKTEQVPEVFSIDVQTNELELSHISDPSVREGVEVVIGEYVPKKSREVGVHSVKRR